MNYPIYILFGVLPSIIWLLFYLRKDVHPEPKSEVIKTFSFGMLVAFIAVFVERGIFNLTEQTTSSIFLRMVLNTFLGVALVEEVLKYLVVRETVLTHPEFDEPVDAMLYMIIAALGFAAAENILIFFQLKAFVFHQTLFVLALRFLGATFLHALSSGTVGFWLGLSFWRGKKEGFKFPALGLSITVVLHGLYNFSIIKGGLSLLIPGVILLILALFVSAGFKKLKKVKQVI